jgi:hypothetical protein
MGSPPCGTVSDTAQISIRTQQAQSDSRADLWVSALRRPARRSGKKNTKIVPHLCVREEVLAMLIAGAMRAMGAFDVAIPFVMNESTPLP